MKVKKQNRRKILYTAAAALFWLLVWQAVAMLYGMDFVLPSPIKTAQVLQESVCEPSFWRAVFFSVSRILLGFALSAAVGIVLSLLSIKVKLIGHLFSPFCSVIRAVPVASFIILVLVMFSSKNVSTVVAALMGFPVVYSTLVRGIEAAPAELVEAADVFSLGYFARLKFIYLPHLAPYMASGLSVACGLSFKSGIAAEVIGYPTGSVGAAMYQAKLGLDMPKLLSYTVVIVCVSVICEKLILLVCKKKGKGESV